MIDHKILTVNEVVLWDLRQLNENFTREAIKEWDKAGEGKFRKWIVIKVTNKWLEMVRSN